MSTNQDLSSGVLATLPVTSLPRPDPACFPTALAGVYANASSLGLATLGQRLLPAPELGGPFQLDLTGPDIPYPP